MNCKHCGTYIDAEHSLTGSYLLERQECSRCNHFITALEWNPKNTLIIGGEMYTVGKESDDADPKWRGCGGSLRFFEFYNSDICYKSTNIWHRGTVPAHFREIMPDNALWVSWQNPNFAIDKCQILC